MVAMGEGSMVDRDDVSVIVVPQLTVRYCCMSDMGNHQLLVNSVK